MNKLKLRKVKHIAQDPRTSKRELKFHQCPPTIKPVSFSTLSFPVMLMLYFRRLNFNLKPLKIYPFQIALVFTQESHWLYMNICLSFSQNFLEKIPTVLFYSERLHCYFEKILIALNSWNTSQGKIPLLFAPAVVARFQMSGWVISLYSGRMWNSGEYFEMPDTYNVASRQRGVIGQCLADGIMSWKGYWQMDLTIWAKRKSFWLLTESTRKAPKESTPF